MQQIVALNKNKRYYEANAAKLAAYALMVPPVEQTKVCAFMKSPFSL